MRNRPFFRRLAIPLLSLALIIAIGGVSQACPTCKDSLAQNDASHATLVRGYFWSILFMMAMPFLILASLGTYMYVLIRQARRVRSAATAAVCPELETRSPVLPERIQGRDLFLAK